MQEFEQEYPPEPLDIPAGYDAESIEGEAITSPWGEEDTYPHASEQPPTAHQTLTSEQLDTYAHTVIAAGLTGEEAAGLLDHTLRYSRYPEWDDNPPLLAARLRLVVEASHATRAGHTDPDSIINETTSIIDAVASRELAHTGLGAHLAGLRAGLTMEESGTLIKTFLDTANYRQAGGLSELRDALRCTNRLAIDPSQTILLMRAVVHEVPPAQRDAVLHDITTALTHGCARSGITPNELMQAICSEAVRGEVGLVQETLRLMVGEEPFATGYNPRQDLAGLRVPPEKRFVPSGWLFDTAGVSIRAQGSMYDGLSDLTKLAGRTLQGGEFTGEGAWVFNAETNEWYGMGGLPPDTDNERLLAHGHAYVPYDLSQLGTAPHTFHLHTFDTHSEHNPLGPLLPAGEDFIQLAGQIEQASMPIDPQAFIVTPVGIVQYVHNGDPADLQRVGNTFDGMLQRFHDAYGSIGINQHGAPYARKAAALTRRAIQELNRQLPPGFYLQFFSSAEALVERLDPKKPIDD